MAKKLTQHTSLRTIDDATDCLRQLKEITVRLERIDTEATAAKLQVEERYAAELRPLQERKLALETDLKLFASENRGLFERTRTIQTPFGSFGFRLSPPRVEVRMKRMSDVIAAIRALGTRFKGYIKTSESLDKVAVKTAYDEGRLSTDDLARMGLSIEQSDEFGYDVERTDSEAVTAGASR